jgi:hypothetical protein
MNVAAEFMDELRSLFGEEQRKNASDYVGKIIRRARSTFEVISYDAKRKEVHLKDSFGKESVVHAKEFFSRPIEIVD